MGNVCSSNAVRDVYHVASSSTPVAPTSRVAPTRRVAPTSRVAPIPISPTIPVCENINIKCHTSGGYGCFIFDIGTVFGQLKGSLWDNSTICKIDKNSSTNKKLSTNKLDDSQKDTLWQFLIQPDICIKIFLSEDRDETAIFQEVESYYILKDEIFKNEMEKFTTFAPCPGLNTISTSNDNVAFQLQLPENTYINIGKNNNDVVKKQKINFILHTRCQSSVAEMVKNKNYIKKELQEQLFSNLLTTVYRIHKSRYAHGDIKLENIVYCPNIVNPFKLIDYNLINLKIDRYDNIRNIIRTEVYTHPVFQYFCEVQKKYNSNVEVIALEKNKYGNMRKDYNHFIENHFIDELISKINFEIITKVYNTNTDIEHVFKDTIKSINTFAKDIDLDNYFSKNMNEKIGEENKINNKIDILLNKPTNALFYKNDEYAIALVFAQAFGYDSIIKSDTFIKMLYDNILLSYDHYLCDFNTFKGIFQYLKQYLKQY